MKERRRELINSSPAMKMLYNILNYHLSTDLTEYESGGIKEEIDRLATEQMLDSKYPMGSERWQRAFDIKVLRIRRARAKNRKPLQIPYELFGTDEAGKNLCEELRDKFKGLISDSRNKPRTHAEVRAYMVDMFAKIKGIHIDVKNDSLNKVEEVAKLESEIKKNKKLHEEYTTSLAEAIATLERFDARRAEIMASDAYLLEMAEGVEGPLRKELSKMMYGGSRGELRRSQTKLEEGLANTEALLEIAEIFTDRSRGFFIKRMA